MSSDAYLQIRAALDTTTEVTGGDSRTNVGAVFIQKEIEPEFKDGDDNDGSGIEMIQIIPYDNGWVLNVDVDNEDADDIREVYRHDQKKDLMKRLEELL